MQQQHHPPGARFPAVHRGTADRPRHRASKTHDVIVAEILGCSYRDVRCHADVHAGPTWTIGELAAECGLTVRALRSLGLPLAQIAVALESPTALEHALSAQLTQLDRQLTDLAELRTQLQRLVGRRSQETITIEELMTMIRKTAVSQEILHEYLDEADRIRLAQRAEALAAQWGSDRSEGTQTSDKVQRMWTERSMQITVQDHSELAEYVRTARAHCRATR